MRDFEGWEDNKNIELRKVGNGNDDSNASTSSDNKKHKEKNVFKLRNNPKKDAKSRNKSRFVGGHDAQSHSPVYE
jgi:hypothetical protein